MSRQKRKNAPAPDTRNHYTTFPYPTIIALFSGPGDKPEDFNGKNQVATRIVHG
jgi:hypothetical protein